MHRFWLSSDQQANRPMVPVSRDIKGIHHLFMDYGFASPGPIRAIAARHNRQTAAKRYCRVGYGFKPYVPKK